MSRLEASASRKIWKVIAVAQYLFRQFRGHYIWTTMPDLWQPLRKQVFSLFYSVSSSSCLVVYHLVIRSKFPIKFWDATHGEHVDSYPLPLSLSDSSFQKVVDIYKEKKNIPEDLFEDNGVSHPEWSSPNCFVNEKGGTKLYAPLPPEISVNRFFCFLLLFFPMYTLVCYLSSCASWNNRHPSLLM